MITLLAFFILCIMSISVIISAGLIITILRKMFDKILYLFTNDREWTKATIINVEKVDLKNNKRFYSYHLDNGKVIHKTRDKDLDDQSRLTSGMTIEYKNYNGKTLIEKV